MKGIHNVIVETPTVKFNIKIQNKVTVVTGTSGSGKTLLVQSVANAEMGVFGYSVKDDYGYSVQSANRELLKHQLKPRTIYIIDNDVCYPILSSPVVYSALLSKMIDSDSCFILLTRGIVNRIPNVDFKSLVWTEGSIILI